MLNRFLRQDKRRPSAPDGLRVYAIGDIHGCADALDALLAKIERDAQDGPAHQLIFLGDYVDRGPASRDVLDRLVEIAASDADAVFLKGNHEAAMLDFLVDPHDNAAWLEWGGEETLESFGVERVLARPPHELADDLRARLTGAQISFLMALELHHAAGDYFFVHAGVRPGVPLSEQREDDLLWIREVFHKAAPNERPAQVIVHGHHPVRRPLDAGWRIAVDTGACYGGDLTAVVLEKESRRFLSVDARG